MCVHLQQLFSSSSAPTFATNGRSYVLQNGGSNVLKTCQPYQLLYFRKSKGPRGKQYKAIGKIFLYQGKYFTSAYNNFSNKLKVNYQIHAVHKDMISFKLTFIFGPGLIFTHLKKYVEN